MANIVLESLTVCPDRVRATVAMDPAHAFMTPALLEQVLREFPDLTNHTCRNAEGDVFGAVADHTNFAHLLEHVVVDLQVRACADPEKIFTGITRVTDAKRGIATIEVSYQDDLVALRAFRDAAAFINRLR